MKCLRPPGFRVLPMDGVIRVGPGERLLWTEGMLPDPTVEKWRETMRGLRGEFLGGGFDVYNSLVMLWLADRFSTLDPAYGGIEFFASEAKLRRNTLGQKVKAVREILE